MSVEEVAASGADRHEPAGAFPVLDEDQMGVLARVGERRSYPPNSRLFTTGDRSYDLMVITSGRVAVVDGYGTEDERLVVEHGAGRFLGEMNLLTGQVVYLSAIARTAVDVIAVAPQALRRVLAEEPTVSEVILRALLLRRSILLGAGVGVRVIGSRYSSDTGRLLEFLARARVPSTWLDLENDTGAEALLTAAGVGAQETPVVITRGTTVLRNPSNDELAVAIGLIDDRTPTAADEVWDLVVVGSGPAGLAAAVYGASEGLRTLGMDAVAAGGQAGTSSRIENYLGFPAGLSGADLAARAALQAEKFGARLTSPCEAAALRAEGTLHVLTLASGDEVVGRSVILATGARYRRLDVPDAARFEGLGVYYAATQAEASRCSKGPVVVIGGGNSAGQAAVFLAARAPAVHLVIRGDDLSARMSRYLIDQIEREPRIRLHPRTQVVAVRGGQRLEQARLSTRGRQSDLEVGGVFVFIGARAHTSWLHGEVATDRAGFVLTGVDSGRIDAPFLGTSRPGVFAAGDVRAGSIKRVAAAVGEGSQAVTLVHQHLASTFALT